MINRLSAPKMLQLKGKLAKRRNVKKQTPEQLAARAKSRVIDKIGIGEYDKLRDQFKVLASQRSKSSASLLDGMIMGLLQQNLTNRQIREIVSVGNNRINRIREVVENPELLKKGRPRPKHAATPEDIDRLKAHIATYDTEDGYPCAHRRLLKFFVTQGLT